MLMMMMMMMRLRIRMMMIMMMMILMMMDEPRPPSTIGLVLYLGKLSGSPGSSVVPEECDRIPIPSNAKTSA
jgi:hypothetical protein